MGGSGERGAARVRFGGKLLSVFLPIKTEWERV